MKGLAPTLHPNKDRDPIWLPGHVVLSPGSVRESPTPASVGGGGCTETTRVASQQAWREPVLSPGTADQVVLSHQWP